MPCPKNLRKVSDSVFHEVTSPETKGKPREWRRSFNTTLLTLKNIEIVSISNVHDREWNRLGKKDEDAFDLLKPNIHDVLIIKAIADEDEIVDHFYFVVEEDGNDIVTLEKAKGYVEITISPGEPTEQGNEFPKGLYPSHLDRIDGIGADFLVDDCTTIDISIPDKQFQLLVKSLHTGAPLTINIGIDIRSFMSEVDTALREHYQPKSIVIDGHSICFVTRVVATSTFGVHDEESPIEEDNEDPDDDCFLSDESITPEHQSHQELLQALSSHSTSLNGLEKAMWILIGVLGLSVFF